jgi:hypothetical protein
MKKTPKALSAAKPDFFKTTFPAAGGKKIYKTFVSLRELRGKNGCIRAGFVGRIKNN